MLDWFNVEYKLMFTCQLEVCGNIIFVILNSHHIKGTLSLSWNHLIALKGNEACIRDPYVTVIFKELTKEMIRSLDEKVFSCVVLTSAHFFFFLNFQNDFNKQTSHHPLLLNMTHELYLSACPKKMYCFSRWQKV